MVFLLFFLYAEFQSVVMSPFQWRHLYRAVTFEEYAICDTCNKLKYHFNSNNDCIRNTRSLCKNNLSTQNDRAEVVQPFFSNKKCMITIEHKSFVFVEDFHWRNIRLNLNGSRNCEMRHKTVVFYLSDDGQFRKYFDSLIGGFVFPKYSYRFAPSAGAQKDVLFLFWKFRPGDPLTRFIYHKK